MSSNQEAPDPKEIEIFYEAAVQNDDLNAQLDAMAEMGGGEFLLTKASDVGFVSRKYRFENEEEADDFFEMANLAISKHFKMEFLKPDELVKNLYWTSAQATFHHADFEKKDPAHRFAVMLRAALSSYLSVEMFDILLCDTGEEEFPYMVIWAFPNESIIEFEGEDEESGEDFMKYLDSSKPKKKEELN